MLERLLRRHARHRPLVLVVVDAAALDPEAAWLLAQLSGLLDDAPVTWLLVEHGGETGGHTELPHAPPRVTVPAQFRRPNARVIELRPSAAPVNNGSGGAHGRHGERPRFGWHSLTEKEVKVARLIADGHTNRSAAAALFISTNTVSTHLRSVFAKLDVNSRVQLTRVALSHPAGSPAGD